MPSLSQKRNNSRTIPQRKRRDKDERLLVARSALLVAAPLTADDSSSSYSSNNNSNDNNDGSLLAMFSPRNENVAARHRRRSPKRPTPVDSIRKNQYASPAPVFTFQRRKGMDPKEKEEEDSILIQVTSAPRNRTTLSTTSSGRTARKRKATGLSPHNEEEEVLDTGDSQWRDGGAWEDDSVLLKSTAERPRSGDRRRLELRSPTTEHKRQPTLLVNLLHPKKKRIVTNGKDTWSPSHHSRVAPRMSTTTTTLEAVTRHAMPENDSDDSDGDNHRTPRPKAASRSVVSFSGNTKPMKRSTATSVASAPAQIIRTNRQRANPESALGVQAPAYRSSAASSPRPGDDDYQFYFHIANEEEEDDDGDGDDHTEESKLDQQQQRTSPPVVLSPATMQSALDIMQDCATRRARSTILANGGSSTDRVSMDRHAQKILQAVRKRLQAATTTTTVAAHHKQPLPLPLTRRNKDHQYIGVTTTTTTAKTQRHEAELATDTRRLLQLRRQRVQLQDAVQEEQAVLEQNRNDYRTSVRAERKRTPPLLVWSTLVSASNNSAPNSRQTRSSTTGKEPPSSDGSDSDNDGHSDDDCLFTTVTKQHYKLRPTPPGTMEKVIEVMIHPRKLRASQPNQDAKTKYVAAD